MAPSLGARAVQGIAAAVLIAIGMALAGNTSLRGGVGTAMGAIGTMSALGTALGPSLGGFLVSGLGWRALFIAPVPLAVMALVLVRGNVPEDGGHAPAGAPGADIAGTAFLALAVGTYALAMSGVTGIAGIGNGLLLVGAATFVVIFLVVEARRAAPLFPPDVFRHAGLGVSLVLNGIVASVIMTTLMVGPFYLSDELGLGRPRRGSC